MAIKASGANISNCGAGIVALDGGIINADGANLSGCGIGVISDSASEVNVNNANLENCAIGLLSINELDEFIKILNEKIAEYTYGVLKDKESFHINFIMNVSPNCDCWNSNDLPIVPDIGILASLDPVAIDKASADLVNKAEVIKGSVLDQTNNNGDKFECIHGNIDYMSGLLYAEELKLGTINYELIE